MKTLRNDFLRFVKQYLNILNYRDGVIKAVGQVGVGEVEKEAAGPAGEGGWEEK